MQVAVRPFVAGDVESAVALATEMGWAAGLCSFTVLCEHDPEGNFVAQAGAEVIGMVTATVYRETAWIGYLMVSRARGRLGLGTTLFARALGYVARRGIGTVRLDADPPGIRIYRRFGFEDQFASRRFVLSGSRAGWPGGTGLVMALEGRYLDATAELDRQVFGDNRRRLVRLLHAHASAAWGVKEDGSLAGYAMLTALKEGYQLGPWIARDSAVASRLLDAALSHTPGQAVRVCVPGPNQAAAALLLAAGFEERRPSLRMIRGEPRAGGMPKCLFGLGSGAIG